MATEHADQHEQYKDKTDEQIAQDFQGDPENTELFSILVDRYQPKLTRYGNRMLFNNSDVEDVVQEVFIKAYTNFQGFDPGKKFSSWIYRIAHNEFINHGKKFSRQLISYFDFDTFFPQISSATELDKEFDREEFISILDKHMDELEEKYREPLLLYVYEQMSYQEISDVLRIPISTVGVRIKRGRDTLKAKLKKIQ